MATPGRGSSADATATTLCPPAREPARYQVRRPVGAVLPDGGGGSVRMPLRCEVVSVPPAPDVCSVPACQVPARRGTRARRVRSGARGSAPGSPAGPGDLHRATPRGHRDGARVDSRGLAALPESVPPALGGVSLRRRVGGDPGARRARARSPPRARPLAVPRLAGDQCDVASSVPGVVARELAERAQRARSGPLRDEVRCEGRRNLGFHATVARARRRGPLRDAVPFVLGRFLGSVCACVQDLQAAMRFRSQVESVERSTPRGSR